MRNKRKNLKKSFFPREDNMDFFCDSGIVIAYCLPGDPYHNTCNQHFSIYPLGTYRYYYCKEVHDEYQKIKEKRKNNAKLEIGKMLRIISRMEAELFEIMIAKNFHNHKQFNSLNDYINTNLSNITGKNPHLLEKDSKILTNSILWDYHDSPQNPTFLSVDIHDILNNHEHIKSWAKSILDYETNLDFRLLST